MCAGGVGGGVFPAMLGALFDLFPTLHCSMEAEMSETGVIERGWDMG